MRKHSTTPFLATIVLSVIAGFVVANIVGNLIIR
jgi:hypothetical protein